MLPAILRILQEAKHKHTQAADTHFIREFGVNNFPIYACPFTTYLYVPFRLALVPETQNTPAGHQFVASLLVLPLWLQKFISKFVS